MVLGQGCCDAISPLDDRHPALEVDVEVVPLGETGDPVGIDMGEFDA